MQRRLGMLIDLALCIGCNACAVACKLENDVPQGCFNVWVESWDARRSDGRVCRANLPKQCNHCDRPACVEVCKTGASHVGPDGIVALDEGKCIGCRACMAACPYEARWVLDDRIARKCTFCEHRVMNGMMPACAATCVTGARLFGDLDDPESDIARRIAAAGGAEALQPELAFKPKVLYLGLSETLAAPRLSAVHKGGNVLAPYRG